MKLTSVMDSLVNFLQNDTSLIGIDQGVTEISKFKKFVPMRKMAKRSKVQRSVTPNLLVLFH